MPYVRLDCDLLESSLWDWTPERHIFITALLMAKPKEIETPMRQIRVDSLQETDFVVPPGKYGFVNASGTMIIKKALGLSQNDVLPDGEKYDQPFLDAMAALGALGSPDPDSRSQEFEGRRLVRVNGGYVVLNFYRFRDKDYTSAERKRRQRERESGVTPDEPSVTAVTTETSHPVTQAEAEGRKQKQGSVRNAKLVPTKGDSKKDDETWWKELRENHAYRNLDIDVEIGKAMAWISTRPKRQFTRRFFVGWLNNALEYAKGLNLPEGYRKKSPVTQSELDQLEKEAEAFGIRYTAVQEAVEKLKFKNPSISIDELRAAILPNEEIL